MKKFAFLLIVFLPFIAFSQIQQPVKWKFESEMQGKDVYLKCSAKIENKWHMYSQFVQEELPVATRIKFNTNNNFSTIGKVDEGKAIEKDDPMFGVVIKYFEDKAVFRQKIKVNSEKDFSVKGEIEYVTCNDNMCTPPEIVEFEIKVKGQSIVKEAQVDSVKTILESDTAKVVPAAPSEIKPSPQIAPIDDAKKSLLGIFIAGFLGGLLALLTPCVFPMIPLTVSYFTKQASSRSKGFLTALFYGLSIIGIYTGLGLLITVVFGSDALNEMASNGIVNVLFFIIFIVFAISFLGAFEITLPNSLLNKADSASDKGGLGGIFFMAVTLSLVSFSCTGPIIGSLLVEAAVQGNLVGPAVGMFGFSFALALPFGLFAAFPSLLKSLPKSGGWLNTVKVSLGFLELALAMKFISTVDLAYHWNIITREVFLACWIAIFSSWVLYLLGIIRFPHDDETKHISVGRGLTAMIVFSFVIYLIPGIFGAPLKIISGFPPPSFYSEGWQAGGGNASKNENKEVAKGIIREHCPHGLSCFHDYDLALAHAKKVGKPLMVDYTGWSCVNCRKMEDQVWSDPAVLERLENKYVLVSLYVDDKEPLPDDQQYVSPTTGKKIKTVGNKWSDMQIKRYKTNSQPYYVLLDHTENILSAPTAYNSNIPEYIAFLDGGLTEFSKRN